MTLLLALIAAPFAVAAALLCARPNWLRKIVVVAAVLAAITGSIFLATRSTLGNPGQIPVDHHWLGLGATFVEIAIGVYVLYVGLRFRRPLIVGLTIAQAGLMLWFEHIAGAGLETAGDLFVDKFAAIMALINGVVGGGICLYAIGYMREYHEVAHRDVRDRRPLFFAVLFAFMGAMFGLIFANNLVWFYVFWEITTLCSFVLIGYTQTEEARRNALRALAMNLAGGVAFALAIIWCNQRIHTVELQALIASKQALALLPAALLCFAGITKSAQLPFSSWLLGAMVAPTPVSALLHSSTMVKAGVYLVLRMAPVITGTKVGLLVALVGSVTFLVGSLAAITTSEAKRVLAYSTVANLGLIVLCGGIGTYAAVWAGILLLIFHAVSKCLLFLCVGVVEHKLHSRDIEAMSGLIVRMPQTAVMMLVGMAGMFLAPFGMLISKWAVLKAVVDACAPLSVFVVFGSAATLFFWVKWMGKLLEVIGSPERVEKECVLGERLTLYGLSAGTFLTCLLFPLISSRFVTPYLTEVFAQSSDVVQMSQGNLIIMSIMMAMILLFPLSFIYHAHGVRVTDAYLGGANVRSGARFLGSANQVQDVTIRNYYLSGVLSETWLSRWGVWSCSALLAAMIVLAYV